MPLKKIKDLRSIEDAPLIRKFTVLFILVSLLPFLVLAYVVWQIVEAHPAGLSGVNLWNVVLLIGIAVLVGFFGLRRIFIGFQEIARRGRQALHLGKVLFNDPDLQEQNEIQELRRTFDDITSGMEANIRHLEDSKKTMQYVLSKLAAAISSLDNIDRFLDLIVEITTNALGAKVGMLMLYDEKMNELFVKSVTGGSAKLRSLHLAPGEEGPGWVAKHRKPLFVPELQKTGLNEDAYLQPPLLCAPMVFKDQLVGVLAVSGRNSGGSFGEDELIIINNLASQTAVAVENSRLKENAQQTYIDTISALALAVEARDPYSRGHSDRVAIFAVQLGRKLGLDEDIIDDIQNAAKLHDIGKIGISDSILKKPSTLDGEEWEIMRKHSVIGEGIVKPVCTFARLCSIIRHHHENWDGSGYPDGLKGEEIPIGARVLLVADSFDAITTERPYSKMRDMEAAKEEIKKYSGTRYDPRVVEAFLQIV